MKSNKDFVLKTVQLAMLTGLVVVLQLAGSFIKIGPLPLSLVLVPIVIGACLLGAKSGAFLGGVFGLITMIMGITGVDAFSFLLWTASPVWFIIVCLLKATLAGLFAGLIYKWLGKLFKGKNSLAKTVIASVSAPIVNTGIFVLGMIFFYYDTLSALPSQFPEAFGSFVSPMQLLFIGLAGFNFIGEFAVNLVLSPAIVRILDIIKKRINSN
jgi:uncharacterized membrane protein